jgi:hypothetical protein
MIVTVTVAAGLTVTSRLFGRYPIRLARRVCDPPGTAVNVKEPSSALTADR